VKWELKLTESKMKLMLELKECRGGAGAVTEVRVPLRVDDGGCAGWGVNQVGFASWGGQFRVDKLVYSSWSVQVGV
jgi:hypothetical protein